MPKDRIKLGRLHDSMGNMNDEMNDSIHCAIRKKMEEDDVVLWSGLEGVKERTCREEKGKKDEKGYKAAEQKGRLCNG